MSKTFLFSIPAFGHIRPILELSKRLVQQGDAIKTFSNDNFEEIICSTGAQFASYGRAFPDDFMSRPTKNPIRRIGWLLKAKKTLVPLLTEAVRKEHPDMVMYDTMCPWGKLIARQFGIPAISYSASILTHPSMLKLPPSLFQKYFQYSDEEPDPFTEPISMNEFFDVFKNDADLTLVFTSREFHPLATSYGRHCRFIGPSIDTQSALEMVEPSIARLERGSAIYISLGTFDNRRTDFYKRCIQSLADFNAPVIMSVGKSVTIPELGPIPDNFIVRNHVPQIAILPYVKLIVSHGGMNTVTEGLANKIPLVIFPQMIEQFFIGMRVKALGAGTMISEEDLEAERFRTIIASAADNEFYRHRAAYIAQSFRNAGGTDFALTAIQELKKSKSIS